MTTQLEIIATDARECTGCHGIGTVWSRIGRGAPFRRVCIVCNGNGRTAGPKGV